MATVLLSSLVTMRWVTILIICGFTLPAATLEKLSLDDMIQKSTEIVRGKVSVQAAVVRGPVVYTRYRVAVAAQYKGSPASAGSVDVYVPGGEVPGGKSGSLVQRFAGAPNLVEGQEYVLFLWTSRSGLRQVIGLSQGLFEMKQNPQGVPMVKRNATSETMLDTSGQVVEDAPVSMRLSEMVDRIHRTLTGARQ